MDPVSPPPNLTLLLLTIENQFFFTTAKHPYWRLLLPPITPATTSVEITASSSRIEATPGETVEAEYIVTNFGETATIRMEIADEKNYLSTFSPNQ